MSQKTALVSLLALLLIANSAVTRAAEKSSVAGYSPASAMPQRLAPSAAMRAIQKHPLLPIQRFIQTDELNSTQLRALQQHNRIGRPPVQNGFSRPLSVPARALFEPKSDFQTAPTDVALPNQGGALVKDVNGNLTWGASVAVESAYRLRLQLSGVQIPDNVQMWVYGETGEQIGPFGNELLTAGGKLWTPSVAGSVITIVVSVPEASGASSFTINAVTELFRLATNGQPVLGPQGADDLSCLADVQCFSSSTFSRINDAEKAVAHMQFVDGGGSYICSGGLLNDTDGSSTIPYFLTANHCFDNQSAASSLETFWDFKAASCGGAVPSLGSLPRSNGSTLLATGASEDFTLLRLNSIPGGRVLLGWNAGAGAVGNGTVLNRVAHPQGYAQSFSQTRVNTSLAMCGALPRPNFIYASQLAGGTSGGSSGGVVMLDNGQVVGQLYGVCGANPDISCDAGNGVVDGSLASYWPAVSAYLDPAPQKDLALTIIDAVDGSYSAGDTLVIENKTENTGGLVSGAYRINFYASTDRVINTADYNIGYEDRASLGVGQNHYDNTSLNQAFDSLPDGSYYIGAILSINDAVGGNNSLYDPVPITLSPPPSAIPGNISASDGIYPDKVVVSWDDVADETSYQVYRCSTSSTDSCGEPIGNTAANVTLYEDYAASEDGSLHHYRVKACNAIACSDFSSADTGHITAPVLDAPPDITALDGWNVDFVQVWWIGVSGTDFYQLYRCNSDNVVSCNTIITTTAEQEFYDFEATDNTYNYYAVKACNGNGCSDFSRVESGYRQLPAPTGVSASDGDYADRIHISWSGVSGATGYEVYRCLTGLPSCSNRIATAEPGVIEYWDTSIIDRRIAYAYRIKAINANISLSNSDSAASEVDIGYHKIPAPTNVDASDGVYEDRVIVRWVYSDNTAHNLRVYRCDTTSIGSCGHIGNLGAGQTIYVDYDANTDGKAAYYRIKICRNYGCSDLSFADRGFLSPAWLIFREGFEGD